MKKIVIIYASDGNFLPQTYTSIFSVLQSRSQDYFIYFYIIVSENTKKVNFDKGWEFHSYAINYKYVPDKLYESAEMQLSHISKPTYYRLLIPSLFPGLDKCIYLDGDTLCRSDILELYEEELGSSYLGGCMGSVLGWGKEWEERTAKRINVPDGRKYINAGVLLMNVSKLSEIEDEMLKESMQNYLQQDQDVINKCCYGNIKLLHLKYNLYSWTEILKKGRNIIFRYEPPIVEEALENPCIIHYAGEYTKPWRNNKCILGNLWWHTAQSALPDNIMRELKYETSKTMAQYPDIQLYENIRQSEAIVIFGYSKTGFEVMELICQIFGYGKIKCFSDNDRAKWNMEHDGIRVCAPDLLKQFDGNFYIVIASHRYREEIYLQLLKMGIPENKIGVYGRKTQNCFYSMEKQNL